MCSGVRLSVAIFTLLLTAFSASARADAFADARAVYDKGDLATARTLFEPLAEQGDREAQTMMGHLMGKAPHFDQAASATWYRKAATQGEAVAQFHIAFIALAYDTTEALDWFRKSADQDYAISQWMIASMLMMKTKDVPNEEAFKWMRRSADFENESGPAENLAKWYGLGSGVEKNLEEAYFWAKFAGKTVLAWKHPERKEKRLAALAANEHAPTKLAPQLTTEKKAEIDRRVAAWKPKKRPIFRTESAKPGEASLGSP
jgi:TPR repeat protein